MTPDSEVVLIYTAYLILQQCENTYGYVDQARTAAMFALKQRGWCVELDSAGIPHLERW
jgi:hypothetical protein